MFNTTAKSGLAALIAAAGLATPVVAQLGTELSTVVAANGGQTGELLITEFFYNLAGDEVPGEYVELTNFGGASVDIAGWVVGDIEDPGQIGEFPISSTIPGATIVEPGESIIVIRELDIEDLTSITIGAPAPADDPGTPDVNENLEALIDIQLVTRVTEADVAAWGGPNLNADQVILVEYGFTDRGGLWANSPNIGNEIAAIFDQGVVENPADSGNFVPFGSAGTEDLTLYTSFTSGQNQFEHIENYAAGGANLVDVINQQAFGNDNWPTTTEISGAGGQSITLRSNATSATLNDLGINWGVSRPADVANPATGVVEFTRVTTELFVVPVFEDLDGNPTFDTQAPNPDFDPEQPIDPETNPEFVDLAPFINDGDPVYEITTEANGGLPVFDAEGVQIVEVELLAGIDETNPDNSNLNLGSPGFYNNTPIPDDCNDNGTPDIEDIFFGGFDDCDNNGILDACQIIDGGGTASESDLSDASGGSNDADGNGFLDFCDLAFNPAADCDRDGTPDAVQIDNNGGSGGVGGMLDADGDGKLDVCTVGAVVITEIMFNPNTDFELDWLEIYNPGATTVDLEGFTYIDLAFPDGSQSQPFPAGTTIAPGEALVLVGDNFIEDDGIPGADTPLGDNLAEFQDQWGPGVNAFLVEDFDALSSNARPDIEIPAILNAAGFVVDAANYSANDSSGQPFAGFPGNIDGLSIYVIPEVIAAGTIDEDNDLGSSWRFSIADLDGAYQSAQGTFFTNQSSGNDFGSPGVVASGTSERPVGDLIITELAYFTNSFSSSSVDTMGAIVLDPNAPEFEGGDSEYVEIYNTTNADIDLSGGFLQDEDGRTTGFPVGTVVPAGGVLVVVGFDAEELAENLTPAASLYNAYPGDYPVAVVSAWYDDPDAGFGGNSGPLGIANLSNDPSQVNEFLRLVDGNSDTQDIVNFDDLFPWPLGNQFSNDPLLDSGSIFLRPGNYTEAGNDVGTNWEASSFTGTDGDTTRANDFTLDGTTNDAAAYATPSIINPVFNSFNFFGSPGTLQNVVTITDLGASPVVPTGACCTAPDTDPSAIVEATEERACVLAGGTWSEGGTGADDLLCGICAGDLDGDGDSDADDFIGILVGFGSTVDTGLPVAQRLAEGDLDLDGDVDAEDFIAVLVAFGGGCNVVTLQELLDDGAILD
ncbi:MAG: lamin tail domain-containing protein [Planctomycetota bacterium]